MLRGAGETEITGFDDLSTPHERLHGVHPLKVLSVQCTGQGSVLQGMCWFMVMGQSAPPYAGAVSMFFTCICKPPPQEVEQLPSSIQSETTQSMGQDQVLQGSCFSSSLGHASPSCAASTVTLR